MTEQNPLSSSSTSSIDTAQSGRIEDSESSTALNAISAEEQLSTKYSAHIATAWDSSKRGLVAIKTTPCTRTSRDPLSVTILNQDSARIAAAWGLSKQGQVAIMTIPCTHT